MPLSRWAVVAAFGLGGLGGCTTGWLDESTEAFDHLAIAETSGGAGHLKVTVPVDDDHDAFLLTADVESGYRAVVLSVQSADRERVFDLDDEWDSGRLKTGARYATDVVSLNWPILDGDTPLSPGLWRVEFGVVDEDSKYRSGVGVDLDVILRGAVAPDQGTLRARIVLASTVRTDAEVQRALAVAEGVWADIYAQAGIDLVLIDGTTDEADLEQPGFGSDDAYESISNETDAGDVTVVIAPTISGSPDIYGVAGGIPGPLVGTSRSVVTVAALTHAGSDGLFSPLEERLLGETLAHEVGHYLGLFHPVETDWDMWDAIDDTAECDSQTTCVGQLGTNMMFPFPVCGVATCQAQEDLTPLQQSAMNHYAGVR